MKEDYNSDFYREEYYRALSKQIMAVPHIRLYFYLGILLLFGIPILLTQFSGIVTFGQEAGWVGDTIGGILNPLISLVSVILTFYLIKIQMIEITKNNKDRDIRNFETQFFNLLEYFQNFRKEINTKKQNYFELCLSNLKEIYENLETKPFHTINIESINSEYSTLDDRFKKERLIIMKGAYYLFFFGNKDRDVLNFIDILGGEENSGYLDEDIEKIFSKYLEIDNKNKTIDPIILVNPARPKLSSYFRILWNIYYFIDDNENGLSEIDKKKYGQLVRTMLSQEEQVLIFCNSLLAIGRGWTYNFVSKTENNLIVKYEIIKNIVNYRNVYGLDSSYFYPMEYEFSSVGITSKLK